MADGTRLKEIQEQKDKQVKVKSMGVQIKWWKCRITFRHQYWMLNTTYWMFNSNSKVWLSNYSNTTRTSLALEMVWLQPWTRDLTLELPYTTPSNRKAVAFSGRNITAHKAQGLTMLWTDQSSLTLMGKMVDVGWGGARDTLNWYPYLKIKRYLWHLSLCKENQNSSTNATLKKGVQFLRWTGVLMS